MRSSHSPRRVRSGALAPGELIVAEGDSEAGLFLILSGRVRSSLLTAAGGDRTLALLTPGTCFGEIYLVTDNPHPMSMTADGAVEALELTREGFAAIGRENSELRAAVLETIIFAIQDHVDRSLRAAVTGRVTPVTSS